MLGNDADYLGAGVYAQVLTQHAAVTAASAAAVDVVVAVVGRVPPLQRIGLLQPRPLREIALLLLPLLLQLHHRGMLPEDLIGLLPPV